MFKKIFILLLSSSAVNAETLTASALAPNVSLAPDPVLQDLNQPAPQQITPSQTLTGLPSLTEHDLKTNFLLTQNLLNRLIQIRRWDLVEHVLPFYMSFTERDEVLVRFAEAGLAKEAGDYKKAIGLYREILAERPSLTPVRLELAIALFEDKQNNIAREQFEKVLSDEIPDETQRFTTAYVNAINKRDSWTFRLGINYLNEENINNTSSDRAIGNTGFIKGDGMMPQSGRGLSYNFSVERDINLEGNHYLHIENSLYGKTYWNNHDYDDIINRFSFGYIHQNTRRKISILPFYEKRWYGDKQYKDNVGLRLEYNYWLNNNLQWINSAEYAKQYYKYYKDLDGHVKNISSTMFWLTNPRQFFYVGLDYYSERTGIRQYDSDLKLARIGWGQEWSKGISTRVSLAVGERKYKDKAVLGGLIPLNKVRKDDEFNVNLTLWKRDWHFLGITPKLNYNWRKVSSSIPSMYSYNKSRFMVILEKSF